MAPLGRALTIAALLACGVLLLAGIGGAGAVVPPKRCGTIEVRGKDFRVGGHLVRCRFARRQSRAFLKHGGRPAGWSCTRYPPRVTRIVFTCRQGSKDYYAIRN